MDKRHIYCADLFCGSGGTSTGLMQAAEALGLGVNLVAVNHWPTAIETHTANHPGVTHYCEELETVNPRKAVPGGHLHLLVASPECTHHSNARGGRPMSDQSRATAWHVLRWAEALYVEHILIENVREWRDWGPLGADGRPLPKMKGRLYRQFLASLRALGYTVSEKVVNAADFGDATTRQRLFVQARRGTKRPIWPVPTHVKPVGEASLPGLMDGIPTWKSAREIIDWSLPSKSIYGRKRPLADATLARIFAGLRKYSGLPFLVPNFGEAPGQGPRTHDVQSPLPTVTSHGAGALVNPCLIKFYGGSDAASVDAPVPTITANYEHIGLCEPCLVGAGGPSGAGHPQSVDEPLGTVLTENHRALVQPHLVVLRNHCGAQSVDDPAPTLTAGGNHVGVAEPCLIVNRTHSDARALSESVPTLTTGGNMGIAEPVIVATGHKGGNGSYVYPVERPLSTVTTQTELGVAEPVIIPTTHAGGPDRAHDVNLPLPTITTAHRGEMAVAEPFLMSIRGGADGYLRSSDIDSPMPTATAINPHALVHPFMTEFHGGANGADRTRSVDDPLCTLDTSNRVGLAQPFLVVYYGEGGPVSLDEPLDTITARDRFALVDPRLVTEGLVDKGDIVGWLDIRFRMLQPHELAAAMSFPKTYHFAGNREAQVKQIGNSVAVGTAKALCLEILKGVKP